MDVRFVVVAPTPARKSYKVRLPIVVGRGEEAKFRIQQDSVSRRHCEFDVADGVVCVTDLGSTNGTHVEGRRIDPHARTAVSSGTEVRIGGTLLRVEYAAAGAALGSTVRQHDTVPLASDGATDSESITEMPVVESPATVAADVSPPAETPAFPDVLAAAAVAPADEPAFPDVEAAAVPAESLSFDDVEPAAPPVEGGFDFLASDADSPPAADDKLDDFFKSLS